MIARCNNYWSLQEGKGENGKYFYTLLTCVCSLVFTTKPNYTARISQPEIVQLHEYFK